MNSIYYNKDIYDSINIQSKSGWEVSTRKGGTFNTSHEEWVRVILQESGGRKGHQDGMISMWTVSHRRSTAAPQIYEAGHWQNEGMWRNNDRTGEGKNWGKILEPIYVALVFSWGYKELHTTEWTELNWVFASTLDIMKTIWRELNILEKGFCGQCRADDFGERGKRC